MPLCILEGFLSLPAGLISLPDENKELLQRDKTQSTAVCRLADQLVRRHDFRLVKGLRADN